jgi:TRAP-type C4-dicarboxylate transport system permease small subunit
LFVLAAGMMFVLLAANFLDVLFRTLGIGFVRGVFEWTEMFLPALVFLALAPAQRAEKHVAVDLVTILLPSRVSAALQSIGLLVIAGCLAWWAFAAGVVGWSSFKRGEYRFGLVEVPLWPARLVIPVGVAVTLIWVLLQLWEQVQVLLGRNEPPPPLRVTDVD